MPDRAPNTIRHDAPRRRLHAFTLIEVVLVLGVIAVIASLAAQSYTLAVARARRTEAINVLRAVAVAQEEFFAKSSRFSGSFEELGFDIKVRGGARVSSTLIRGSQYEFNLSQPAGANTWYCSAVGNIDYDEWPDVLTISDQR